MDSGFLGKLLKFLGFLEAAEVVVLKTIPLARIGPAGEILSVALMGEVELAAVLQAFQTVKIQSAPPPAPGLGSATQ